VPMKIWRTIWEKLEPGVDHEIEAAKRFVGLVDAVDEVEHLQLKSMMKM